MPLRDKLGLDTFTGSLAWVVGSTVWVVVGTKTNYERKPNGLRIMKSCPQCKRLVEFFEVIPKNYVTLFWVPLVPTSSDDPVLECTGCHTRYKMSTDDAQAAQSQRTTPPDQQTQPSEKVIVICPHCAAHARIPSTRERIRVTCPSCKQHFRALNGLVL